MCCYCAHSVQFALTSTSTTPLRRNPNERWGCVHFWVPSVSFGVSERMLRSLLDLSWLTTNTSNQANHLNTHTTWKMWTAPLTSMCLHALPDQGYSQVWMCIYTRKSHKLVFFIFLAQSMETVFTAYPVLFFNRFFPDAKTVSIILFHHIISCPCKTWNRHIEKNRYDLFFSCDKCNF